MEPEYLTQEQQKQVDDLLREWAETFPSEKLEPLLRGAAVGDMVPRFLGGGFNCAVKDADTGIYTSFKIKPTYRRWYPATGSANV